MKNKLRFLISLILVAMATGCSISEYEKCLDGYEIQRAKNGGNGGIVSPQTFCEDKIPTNSEKTEFIVVYKDKINEEVVIKVGGTIKKNHESIRAVVALLTEKQVDQLRMEEEIDYIEPNHPVSAF